MSFVDYGLGGKAQKYRFGTRDAKAIETLSADTITLEISNRNARVVALQERRDRLRAGLDLVIDARCGHGRSASGMLVRGYKAKKANRLVTRIDPGVVSLVADLRGHEQQAAEESERWIAHHEERKPLDASPAAITLALLLTDEELDSLEKSAGDGEIASSGRPGVSDVVSPQPAARHGEPAEAFPANAAAANGRPRMDGAICRLSEVSLSRPCRSAAS